MSVCLSSALSSVQLLFCSFFWQVKCCLRLLKRFSSKHFESKTRCYGDDCDRQEQVKFGRTVRQTEQLVELPLAFKSTRLLIPKKQRELLLWRWPFAVAFSLLMLVLLHRFIMCFPY